MNVTRVVRFVLPCLIAFAPVSRAVAQVPGVKAPSIGLTIGVKATTLGVGPEVGFKLAPMLSIKGGAQWVTVSRDLTSSGIAYGANVKWRSFDLMLDLHPLGPIHFDAGIIRNGNELNLSAAPTGTVTLGNTTYTAGQVGTITSKISFKKAAPYLGMDFVMGGKVGFLMQLGAMFQGTPVLTYTATPGASLPAAAQTQFNTEVQNEATKVQTDINSRSYFKIWPVVGFGLQVKI
jgi:hypothetical protein